MPRTVIVDGEEMVVGEQTTVAAVRKFADVPDGAVAFYRRDGTVRLLEDTETVAERIPDGGALEFRAGPIGEGTDLATDGERE